MKEYKYKINGNSYTVVIGDIEDNVARVEVNGSLYKVELDKAQKTLKSVAKPAASTAPAAPAVKPVVKPAAAPAQAAPAASAPTAAPAQAAAPAAGGGTGVKSPLPGVILDIKVNVGDEVKKGQLVVVLEAMKMENSINADRDGKITAIKVNKGDSVLEGTDLVMIG